MENEMVERAMLRNYLKRQIAKIRQILELRKLQVLCRLKRLVMKLHDGMFPILHTMNEPIDMQIGMCLYLIEKAV